MHVPTFAIHCAVIYDIKRGLYLTCVPKSSISAKILLLCWNSTSDIVLLHRERDNSKYLHTKTINNFHIHHNGCPHAVPCSGPV